MIEHFRRLFNENLTLDEQVILLRKLPSIHAITGRELALCVNEILSHAISVSLPNGDRYVDIVGTGGDNRHSFNVSTTASFVVAASGVPVVKHGNRAITSRSGGFDVLRALNVTIPETKEAAIKQANLHHLTFLFAPFFHPVFKNFMEARRVLAQAGEKTLLNVFGPLVNPANVKRIAVGVYDPVLIQPFAEALHELGYEKAWVFHGNGMDELSLSGENTLVVLAQGKIHRKVLSASDVGLFSATEFEVIGGDAIHNAAITRTILSGEERGAKREMVVLNAAAAICVGTSLELEDAIALARESIDTGRAYALLNAMTR